MAKEICRSCSRSMAASQDISRELRSTSPNRSSKSKSAKKNKTSLIMRTDIVCIGDVRKRSRLLTTQTKRPACSILVRFEIVISLYYRKMGLWTYWHHYNPSLRGQDFDIVGTTLDLLPKGMESQRMQARTPLGTAAKSL